MHKRRNRYRLHAGTKFEVVLGMADDSRSAFYEIWFEHGVFITPGPRFARLDEAVEHARQMVQARPQTSVSIRFPNTPVDTFVRKKQPDGQRHDPSAHQMFDTIEEMLGETAGDLTVQHNKTTIGDYAARVDHDLYGLEDEDTSVDSFETASDGDTSPYGSPNESASAPPRTSGFLSRTTVMNSNQIKKGLKKLG